MIRFVLSVISVNLYNDQTRCFVDRMGKYFSSLLGQDVASAKIKGRQRRALLAALGERLMEAQNALVPLDPGQDAGVIAQSLLDHVAATWGPIRVLVNNIRDCYAVLGAGNETVEDLDLRDLRSELGIIEDCGRCARCAKQCMDTAIEQLGPPPHPKSGASILLLHPAR